METGSQDVPHSCLPTMRFDLLWIRYRSCFRWKCTKGAVWKGKDLSRALLHSCTRSTRRRRRDSKHVPRFLYVTSFLPPSSFFLPSSIASIETGWISTPSPTHSTYRLPQLNSTDSQLLTPLVCCSPSLPHPSTHESSQHLPHLQRRKCASRAPASPEPRSSSSSSPSLSSSSPRSVSPPLFDPPLIPHRSPPIPTLALSSLSRAPRGSFVPSFSRQLRMGSGSERGRGRGCQS